MTWVDYSVLAILGLSTLVGVFRGFVREALGLVGWLIALFLAVRFAPEVTHWLPGGDFAPLLARQLIAAIAIFIVVALITGVIAWLIAKTLHSIGLGLMDRGLGAIFGLARGLLIVIICAVVAGLSPVVEQPGWQDAKLRGPLETAALAASPYLSRAIPANLKF
jgi:membrane protein required for colicin V production